MLGVVFAAALPSRAIATAGGLQAWNGGDQPTFTLPDTNGADAVLASERGRIVLVHFFATWCEPCREELPALNRLTARADGKLKVLAISVAEVDQRVRRFIESTPVNFPVLLDRERATAKAWGVTTLPTTFVLDANLRPKLVVEADFNWDRIDPAALTDLLTGDVGDSALFVNTNKTSHWGG